MSAARSCSARPTDDSADTVVATFTRAFGITCHSDFDGSAINRKHKQSGTTLAPASAAYEAAFEQDLAAMTVAEFIRWNPRFTEEEARARIAAAKAKVGRMKHKQPSAGACGCCGSPG